MRREFRGTDTFHHVVMRGARGMSIVENDRDRWDFIKLLFYLNDEYQNNQWERDLKNTGCSLFERPGHWPSHNPLIYICGFCLMGNHFHLLAKEIKLGGLSSFMHRLPNSMTLRHNKNHNGTGSIFQGPYKSRMVENQSDLINVALYVTVKNVFEKFPQGGIMEAASNFQEAHGWALEDPFSSYADFAGNRNSPIVEKDILADALPQYRFKKDAREYLRAYAGGRRGHEDHLFLK